MSCLRIAILISIQDRQVVGMKQKETAVCTTGLIIVNIGIFLLAMFVGKSEDTLFLLEHGAMYPPYVIEGREYYRLITSVFLHFGIEHLLNNIVMLGALGWYLEPAAGKLRFLIIYFVSGIGGNILSLMANRHYGRLVVSAGASGAVFGLMGALVFVVIRNQGKPGRLNKKGMLVMVVLSLYLGFTDVGVDNIAHIGGLLCGFVTAAILLYRPKRTFCPPSV